MLLLDTHIWIRWHNPQPNSLALPQNLITLIETSERVVISAISCWELGQLVKRTRVKLSLSLEEWVEATIEEDIEILPIGRFIATKAAQLPEHHRDPADRIIIATALAYDAYLVSLDSMFPNYIELKGRLLSS